MNFLRNWQNNEISVLLVLAAWGLGLYAMARACIWIATRGRKPHVDRHDAGVDGDDDDDAGEICPDCGYDVRATPSRCPECGTALHERRRYRLALATEWPSNPIVPRRPQPDEIPVLLLSTADFREANLLKEQLNSRGMPCSVSKGAPAGPYRARVTYYRVVIYGGDEDTAKAYLQRIRGDATAAPD